MSLAVSARLSADYGLLEDLVNVQYVRVVRKHAPQVMRDNVEVFQRKPRPTRGLSRNGVKNYSKGPCVTFLE